MLSVVSVNNIKITDSYNTLSSDLSTLQPLLDKLQIDIKNNIGIKIHTNKGYISNNTYKYKNNKVEIVIPSRQKTIK